MLWFVGAFVVCIIIQIGVGVLTLGLVHDMIIKAYRQLWREQQAAILLHERNLEDTPPAQEEK